MTNREEVEVDEQNPFSLPAADVGLNRLVVELANVDQNLQEIAEQEKQLIRDRAESQRRRNELIVAIRKALPPGVLPEPEQKAQPGLPVYPPGVRSKGKQSLTLSDGSGYEETVEVSGI